MKKVKLVDVAQDGIMEMIESKDYNDNGFLLSEGDLAIKLSVSRSTIREAVRSMEIRGFVKRIHGKGVQVINNSSKAMQRSFEDMISHDSNNIEDILETRVIIEPNCAALAALRKSDEDLKTLEKCVIVMENASEMDNEYYKADLDFHTTLAKASGNKILELFIKSYTNIIETIIIESSTEIHPIEKSHHYHRNILEAIKKGDTREAFSEMEIHLKATNRNLKKHDIY